MIYINYFDLTTHGVDTHSNIYLTTYMIIIIC